MIKPEGTGPKASEKAEGPSRLDGPLSRDRIRDLRAGDTPLAFDPVQSGWIPAHAQDEPIADADRPGWPDAAAPRGTARDTTAELSLRQWRASDAGVFRDLLGDPQMWAYMPQPFPEPFTLDTASDLIELSNSSNHHEVRAVLAGDRVIGQVRLEFAGAGAPLGGDELGGAELSYWLGRAFWGQGFATRMVDGFVRRSFEKHPAIPTLFARVDDRNVASRKVLEKCGFAAAGPDPERPGWTILSRSRDR